MIQVAMGAVQCQMNGANLLAMKDLRGHMNAAHTPLEAEWMWEVADATIRSGLDRVSASKLLARLASVMDGKEPERPVDIRECYDLVRHCPKPFYEQIYLRVKDQLASWGLDFA